LPMITLFPSQGDFCATALRRLRTDHLDLWQLHDLCTPSDLERIFAKGGALAALVQAREEGRVRFLGLTGHHDPAILLEAMRRFAFDTVLVALNAADIHRLSFIPTVLAEAARRDMGVIGMKVYAQGALLDRDLATADEAMGYVLSLPGVSTIIVGCRTPAEVDDNARIARQFVSFETPRMRQLEVRTRWQAAALTSYKKPMSCFVLEPLDPSMDAMSAWRFQPHRAVSSVLTLPHMLEPQGSVF